MISWKFVARIHFCLVDKWLLQLGVSCNTSPVDSEDRTPDMPIGRQIRYKLASGTFYSQYSAPRAHFV
jgi:hypothetical protein